MRTCVMCKVTLNTDSNAPELDKGGKDHILRPDWVSTGLVPRCRVLDEVILKMMVIEYRKTRRKWYENTEPYLW
jgi:hypothetical protein